MFKRIKPSTLIIFLLLVMVVSSVHYFLLKPVLLTGFEHDDWGGIGGFNNPSLPHGISKMFYLWSNKRTSDSVGIHHTMQYMYIGTLFEILKFNYPMYNVVSIILKTIATLSIFPLVVVIFRKRLLAILTTILHAISYSATSALTYVLQGVFYLGITFMNIFFIFYYFAVNKNSKIYLLLASLSLILAYWLAPGRIYPIFAFILLIELFLNFKYGFKKTIKKSVVRLALFYIPIILLILVGRRNYTYLGSPSLTLKWLTDGNWHLILHSLTGLGYLILPSSYAKIIGYLDLQNFGDYISFLIKKHFLILTPLTLILGFILSKNILKFSILLLAINFLIDILIFFIATHYLSIPKDLVTGVDPGVFWPQQYYSLFAVYILTVSAFCFWQWRKIKEGGEVLLATFVGPIFALIFLFGTWLILGNLSLYGGINRYFPFASLGSSLFVASIFTLLWDRVKHKGFIIKGIILSFIFIILIFIYQLSSKEIDTAFREVSVRNSYLHQHFQESFMNQLPKEKIATKNSMIFYFFVPDLSQEKAFEQAFDLHNFKVWMYFRLGGPAIGPKCIGLLKGEAELIKAIQTKQGEKVLSSNSRGGCSYAAENVIYKPEDLYAFRVEGDRFTDITDKVLQKFELK